jgi:phosphatidylserine/phosphatidylglycerophosphate/cardiolipin synthase-like enzyme
VLIARRGGAPVKALCGSTNFSFRGLYIQANNMLVFSEPGIADLFGQMFDIAFADPTKLGQNPFTKAWHVVTPAAGPTVSICFSPHPSGSAVSLSPVAGAIDQASSSVLYSVAFLNQDKNGPVRQALDRLMGRPLFSYGVVDKSGGLSVKKPDGSVALVPFSYLAKTAPEPFKTEWGGGSGITVHHKFVVTDFNKPTAKLFTGSSNLANGGEQQNGDHLIQIDDSRVATVYAIEALRMFDHLHFRSNMKALGKQAPTVIKLWKPGDPGPAWWNPFYIAGSQKAGDRLLFGS